MLCYKCGADGSDITSSSDGGIFKTLGIASDTIRMALLRRFAEFIPNAEAELRDRTEQNESSVDDVIKVEFGMMTSS